MNINPKKTGAATLISDNVDHRAGTTTSNKEGHYIMETVTPARTLDGAAPNTRASKHIQTLPEQP